MNLDVVLFHSALGLRPAVRDLAARLRDRGCRAHTPDLFHGRAFDVLADGIRYRDEIGVAELMRRASDAVAGIDGPILLAGFSMGCGAAQLLAVDRDNVQGLVLMHGALAPDKLGIDLWPEIPVQMHYGPRDPWVDEDQVDALHASALKSGVLCEVFRYEAEGHLFDEPASDFYAAALAEKMHSRVAEFARRLRDREMR